METTKIQLPQEGLRRITSAFNGRLLFSVCLIALSQVNFGAEQSAFSNTQAMIFFNMQFGTYDAAKKTYAIEPYFLSLLNSLNYIGFAFGLITGNLISKKYGRRIAMFVMCLWALLASTLLVTSHSRYQMLVGRIIGYIYIGMELAIVPVLQSELVHARVRGFVVCTYQLGLLFGSLLMSIICRGTSSLNSHASWRIPLGMLYVIPSIIAVAVWFMPESPHWLLMSNREDDAFTSLRALRRGAFTEEEISAEFHKIKASLDQKVEKGQFTEMFQGTNRKRTFIAIGTNISLQLTGQNFVSIYGTIFIRSLKTINPFTMSCINSTISILVVSLTMILSDKWGRRNLMIMGAAIQMFALYIMGGLGTRENPSFPVRQAITAMVSLFGIGFTLGWAPLSHVVTAEIPTTRLRDVTYATASIFNICIQFSISFSIPYLLFAPYANLGSKVGFIFGTSALGALFFSYFCIPECKGKTLEEIDQLFVERVPIRKFATTQLSDLVGRSDVESFNRSEVQVVISLAGKARNSE